MASGRFHRVGMLREVESMMARLYYGGSQTKKRREHDREPLLDWDAAQPACLYIFIYSHGNASRPQKTRRVASLAPNRRIVLMEPLGPLSQFGPFRPYDPPGYDFIPPSPDGGDAEAYWDESLDEQGRRAYFSSRPSAEGLSAEGLSSLSAWDWLDFQPTQAVPPNADLTVDGATTESVEEDTFGQVELQERSPEPTAQSEFSYGDGDVTMVEAPELDDEEKMGGDDEGGEQRDALEEFGLYESQGLDLDAMAQFEPSYNYDDVTMAVVSELWDRQEEEEEEMEEEEEEELAEVVEEDIAANEEGTLGLYESQGLSPEAMAQSEPSYDDEKEAQAEEMEAEVEMEMEEAEEDELAENIAAIEKELMRREREGNSEEIGPVPGEKPDATALSTTIISADELLTFNNHPNAAVIAEGHGRRELLDSLLSDGGDNGSSDDADDSSSDDDAGPTALRLTQCVMILAILVVSQSGQYRLDSLPKFQVIFTFLQSGRATSSSTPPLIYAPMSKDHCKALLEWLVDAPAVRSREDFQGLFHKRLPRNLAPGDLWECADTSTTHGIAYVIVFSASLDKVDNITAEFDRLVVKYPNLAKFTDTIAQVTTDIRARRSGSAVSHYLGQTTLKLSRRHPLHGTFQPRAPHLVPLLDTIWKNCGLGQPERLELGSVAKTGALHSALPDSEALNLVEHFLTSVHFPANLNRIPGGRAADLPLAMLLHRQAALAALARLPELLRIRIRDRVRTSVNEVYDDELRRQKHMYLNRTVANRATSARHPFLHPGLTVPRRSTQFVMPFSYETIYHPDSGDILDVRQLSDTFTLNLLPEYQNLAEPILNVYPVSALASTAGAKMWAEREIWDTDGTPRSVRISEVRGTEWQHIRTSQPYLVLDSIRNPDRTPPASECASVSSNAGSDLL
ncbi:hypothetical protein PENSPDRAFT_212775 [Peniophora sp. CONT]|nr:hypothetical protein PENSPDRAFT_212775 [Peniophora sp. CONT]